MAWKLQLQITGTAQIWPIAWKPPYAVSVALKRQTNKQTNKQTCWRGCGETWTLLHCWWECKLLQPQRRTYWRFLKKLKIELAHDLAIPFLGIYLEKIKTLIQKDICIPMFTAALFTIANTWKKPKCPLTEEWIKVWYIYTMEYYSAIKREKIMPSLAT